MIISANSYANKESVSSNAAQWIVNLDKGVEKKYLFQKISQVEEQRSPLRGMKISKSLTFNTRRDFLIEGIFIGQ